MNPKTNKLEGKTILSHLLKVQGDLFKCLLFGQQSWTPNIESTLMNGKHFWSWSVPTISQHPHIGHQSQNRIQKLRNCVFIKQGFKDSLKMTDLALLERLTCFEWEPGESIITVTGASCISLSLKFVVAGTWFGLGSNIQRSEDKNKRTNYYQEGIHWSLIYFSWT